MNDVSPKLALLKNPSPGHFSTSETKSGDALHWCSDDSGLLSQKAGAKYMMAAAFSVRHFRHSLEGQLF